MIFLNDFFKEYIKVFFLLLHLDTRIFYKKVFLKEYIKKYYLKDYFKRIYLNEYFKILEENIFI